MKKTVNKNSKFVFYPGVYLTQGNKNIAIINFAKNELNTISNSEFILENTELQKKLKNAELGIVVDEQNPLLNLPIEKINFEPGEEIRLQLLDNIECVKLLDFKISHIEFYTKQELKEKETLKLFEQNGYTGLVIFNKFQKKCNYECSKFSDEFDIKNYFFNKQYNPCWGLNMAIEKDGTVKPCLWSNIQIGNIYNQPIEEMKNKLQEYWLLTKDKIKICCDCEFRYICSDCRVNAMKKSDKFSKTHGCKYNPFLDL
jgi:radical SAM protein with 4Fe4S-binding SPASM domain